MELEDTLNSKLCAVLESASPLSRDTLVLSH